MYSYTEENYLKAIYKLWAENQMDVNTNAIADVLHTKPASVTDMMKKLADKKLLHYARYKGVSLTDKGRKVAIQTIRKHRLWEVFLHEKLNFGWDQVHEVAEELEHIQSALLIDKLDEFLGYPTHDPHGDPIPTRDGIFRKEKLQVLGELNKNQEGIMAGIKDHSISFCACWTSWASTSERISILLK